MEASPELKRVIQALNDGTISRIRKDGENTTFSELTDELLYGEGGNMPDRYFQMKDFTSYMAAFDRMNADFANTVEWNKKRLANIAASGCFSSDRTIREYAQMVWEL